MEEVQRFILLGTLGMTAYIVASCPCAQMGKCKKELFLGLTLIPLAFAVYNFTNEEICPV
jgi:hypothetical protein